jgi:hypothetical protein
VFDGGMGVIVVFRGVSGRFNISFFVEKPKGEGNTNKDGYKLYWSKASQRPEILKDNVATIETPMYVRVQYRLVAQFKGQAF